MGPRTCTVALTLVLLAACDRGDGGAAPAASGAADTGVEAPSTTELVGAMAKSVAFGPYYIRQAKSERMEDMLALLAQEDPAADPTPLSDAELAHAAKVLGGAVPADLAAVLAVPAAWRGSFGWSEPGAWVRSKAWLADDLAKKLRADGEPWQATEILLEDFHGGSFRLRAGDLEDYVVIAQDLFLGQVVLYDPSEPPRHACCRVVETPVLKSDSVTAYSSARDYVEVAWALAKAQ